MFTEGFEKIAARANPASLAYKAQRMINAPIGKLRTVGGQTRKRLGQIGTDISAGAAAGRMPTRMSPSGSIKKSPGGTLTEKRTAKDLASKKDLSELNKEQIHTNIESKTKDELKERKARIDAHREKIRKGPSFAMRHPFITAGGTLFAAKHLVGDKRQDQGPMGAQDNNWVGSG